MAKYLLLIYGDEAKWAAMPPEEIAKIDAGHRAFAAAAQRSAGVAVLGGDELEPPDVATTLRADGAGRPTATDGPFLETKEAVGGYYLVEAGDLDQVIALTNELYEVTAGHSGVEIRPVVARG